MTTRVAILTPDPADHTYTGLWQQVLARMVDALAREGVTAVPEPWTAHVDDVDGLRGYDRVLGLLAWGYHRDHGRWLRACDAWERAGLPLANPARTLAWNSDKRYLAELATRGIDVPPTAMFDLLQDHDLPPLFDATGAEMLIAKPAVSGGAWKTQRLRRGDMLDDVPPVTMLVQPYLPTIETEGETSLLFFGGELSHVVNKRPPSGEFRVQQQFGGDYRLLAAPPADALALAQRVLAEIDAPLLYARIDMVPDAGGRWWLMEAELIEPDLYLGVDPGKGAAFARAVRADA